MLKRRSIELCDFETVLASDIAVYPTETPLTVETLSKWYTRHPEFGMIYYYDRNEIESKNCENSASKEQVIVGTCCVVPLNAKGWLKLTKGDVIESQLEDDMLFDNSQLSNSENKEIGLHVYHMERYSAWTSVSQFGNKENFGTLVLKGLQEILEQLRVTNKDLRVIGLSGLCVSTSGIHLFSNYYNCRERESFICKEHILSVPSTLSPIETDLFRSNKTGLVVLEINSQGDLVELLKRGYRYITRCKMLVLYPEDCSVVWCYVKP